MAARPFLVIKTTTITYDGVQARFHAGQIVDVPSGSSLGTMLGANARALSVQETSGAAGEHQPVCQSLNLGSHFNPGQN
jgi:hypothetical protein